MGASFSNAADHLEKEFLLSLRIQENNGDASERGRRSSRTKRKNKKDNEMDFKGMFCKDSKIGSQDDSTTTEDGLSDNKIDDDEIEDEEDEEFTFPSPLSALSYPSLLSFSFLDGLEVDIAHIAILYVLDADKDGLFSWSDMRNFIEWCQENVSIEKLDSANRGEFSDAVHARCILQMWKECTQGMQNARCQNKRGHHLLLEGMTNGMLLTSQSNASGSIRRQDKNSSCKPAVVLPLHSNTTSKKLLGSAADGNPNIKDNANRSSTSDVWPPGIPGIPGRVNSLSWDSSGLEIPPLGDVNLGDIDGEDTLQTSVFRDVNNLTDLIVLTTSPAVVKSIDIEEGMLTPGRNIRSNGNPYSARPIREAEIDHDMKVNNSTTTRKNNGVVRDASVQITAVPLHDVPSVTVSRPSEDAPNEALICPDGLQPEVYDLANKNRANARRQESATASLYNPNLPANNITHQGPATLFVDWMLLFLENNFPLPCDDEYDESSGEWGQHKEKCNDDSDKEGEDNKETCPGHTAGTGTHADQGPPSSGTSGTRGGVDGSILRPPHNPNTKPSRYFSLDAIAALHVLLALSDNYGMDLKAFSTILAPQAVADLASEASRNAAEVAAMKDCTEGQSSVGNAGDTEIDGSSEWLSSGSHGALLISLSETHLYVPPLPSPPGVHFRCPEESLRIFLSSFINSYWSVLKRFGLKVLL